VFSEASAFASTPIGDMLQLIGALAFGNAGSGYWFMLTEYAVVLLFGLAATILCFDAGAGVARNTDDAPAPRTITGRRQRSDSPGRAWIRAAAVSHASVCSV
jgi:hypothetical protein